MIEGTALQQACSQLLAASCRWRHGIRGHWQLRNDIIEQVSCHDSHHTPLLDVLAMRGLAALGRGVQHTVSRESGTRATVGNGLWFCKGAPGFARGATSSSRGSRQAAEGLSPTDQALVPYRAQISPTKLE
jgi:hypothetical protein